MSIAPIRPQDRDQLVQLITMQQNFLDCEIEVAIEVIEAACTAEEDYRVLVAADGWQLLGYVSFGPIPMTERRFDLYWIAVDPRQGRRGIGTALVAEMEKRLVSDLPVHIYIETSATEGYRPARLFYEKHGYEVAACLNDFYRDGDSKIVYRKII